MNAPRPFHRLPARYFGTVAADPPWKFQTHSPAGQARIEQHYKTMSLDEIIALPVRDLARRNAFLHLWVPGPFLVKGLHLRVMIAWGFEPVAMSFVWIKTKRGAIMWSLDAVNSFHFGNGYTTRKNAEFCVLGRRGDPVRRSARVRELIISQRREHSRKPTEFIERVEEFSDGPYLEMFSRERRAGWSTWGNQRDKFNESR
mgnify:CR=1 FL=1